jgi:hypothetical protein
VEFIWVKSEEMILAEEVVNIEAIMQSIRQHVLAKESAVPAASPLAHQPGKAMSSEFYKHLQQARIGHDQIHVQLDIGTANMPVIGGLLQSVRRKVHELVLFYVNQMAAKQINVNHHLFCAINILAEEIEKTVETNQAK